MGRVHLELDVRVRGFRGVDAGLSVLGAAHLLVVRGTVRHPLHLDIGGRTLLVRPERDIPEDAVHALVERKHALLRHGERAVLLNLGLYVHMGHGETTRPSRGRRKQPCEHEHEHRQDERDRKATHAHGFSQR